MTGLTAAHRWLMALCVAGLSAAPLAHGQCPFGWRPGQTLAGLDGVVSDMVAWDPDGSGPARELLIAGGQFSIAGDVTARNIAAWDGARWNAFGGELGGVFNLAVYRGDLIASGYFISRWNGEVWESLGTWPPASPATALTVFDDQVIVGTYGTAARWDGTSWHWMDVEFDTGYVTSLAEYDGELYAGTWSTVMRWNGATWQPIGGPGGDYVTALAPSGDYLIAGGSGNIQRWDGIGWQSLGSGITGRTFDLCTYDGDLYAGGEFSLPGGTAPTGVARWNGSSWQPLGDGLGGDLTYVTAFAHYRDELIIGGNFDTAGGAACPHIAGWNGADWRPLNTDEFGNRALNGAIAALTIYDGELVAGGAFTAAGSASANHIARWDGTHWRPLGGGLDGEVKALLVSGDDLIAAGGFSMADGVPAARIARWDGAAWRPLGSGLPGLLEATALTVSNGEIFAGGWYHIGCGRGCLTTRGAVYRWNGAEWEQLGTPTFGVLALAEFNNDLFAGGFTPTDLSCTGPGLSRWNGASWDPLGMDGAECGTVSALRVYDGGLFVAGEFQTVAGAGAPGIARWDGAAWTPLGTGLFGGVAAVDIYGSDVVAGGYFDFDGVWPPEHTVARWDGATWFALDDGPVNGVSALAVLNNELVAGGAFTTAGAHVSAYWARWGLVCARGDISCDGRVDSFDINPFILALLDGDTYQVTHPHCDRHHADCNRDGRVDFFDIDPFLDCLLGDCP